MRQQVPYYYLKIIRNLYIARLLVFLKNPPSNAPANLFSSRRHLADFFFARNVFVLKSEKLSLTVQKLLALDVST